MSERAALALALLLLASPAAAEPRVALLDLPFRVTQLRDAASEAALAVATAGLPQLPRKPGPLAVAWGETGAAVVTLAGDTVTVIPLPLDAIEGLTAGETPKGAVPGSRRVLAGPLSAYLSGTGPDGHRTATALTLRERQPVAMSADPKPVPDATSAVSPGPGAVFAADALRPIEIDGTVNLLAVSERPEGASLAVIGRRDGAWQMRGATPPEPGPLSLAAARPGATPAALLVRGADGRAESWALAGGTPTRQARGGAGFAAPGAALGEGEWVLAAGDRTALAYLSADGLKERARAALPAPVGAGLAVLGSGHGAAIVVALTDGRLATVRDGDARP